MKKTVFFLPAALLFFPCLVPAKHDGTVLSYEITTEERQYAHKLKPIRSVAGKNKKKQTQQAENILENISPNEKTGREHIYLINDMDVYSLSELAHALAMNHMVSPRYYYSESFSHDIDWNAIIETAAQSHAVDKALIWAVIRVESNFVANAVSQKGAVGAMQLMPETQRELGVANPINARDNVLAGTKYLKQQLERFNGNLELALAAYNAGAGNVQKYQGIPPYRETREFVKKVMTFMQNY